MDESNSSGSCSLRMHEQDLYLEKTSEALISTRFNSTWFLLKFFDHTAPSPSPVCTPKLFPIEKMLPIFQKNNSRLMSQHARPSTRISLNGKVSWQGSQVRLIGPRRQDHRPLSCHLQKRNKKTCSVRSIPCKQSCAERFSLSNGSKSTLNDSNSPWATLLTRSLRRSPKQES